MIISTDLVFNSMGLAVMLHNIETKDCFSNTTQRQWINSYIYLEGKKVQEILYKVLNSLFLRYMSAGGQELVRWSGLMATQVGSCHKLNPHGYFKFDVIQL